MKSALKRALINLRILPPTPLELRKLTPKISNPTPPPFEFRNLTDYPLEFYSQNLESYPPRIPLRLPPLEFSKWPYRGPPTKNSWLRPWLYILHTIYEVVNLSE